MPGKTALLQNSRGNSGINAPHLTECIQQVLAHAAHAGLTVDTYDAIRGDHKVLSGNEQQLIAYETKLQRIVAELDRAHPTGRVHREVHPAVFRLTVHATSMYSQARLRFNRRWRGVFFKRPGGGRVLRVRYGAASLRTEGFFPRCTRVAHC